MKILLTGASGFVGKNILSILSKEHEVQTLGRSLSNDIRADIREGGVIDSLSSDYKLVIHAAGKAHVVPKTEEEIKDFFDVNVEGTKNLCKSLERNGLPSAFVFISTAGVYGSANERDVSESHPLNGTAPYAVSKIQAEAYLTEWCHKNGVILTILRPSLIAGQNPPGNLHSMIHGIETGRYLSIAGGKTRKSILMVQDLATLAILASNVGGIFNANDSYAPSFRELEQIISKQLGKRLPISIPYWVAKSLAIVGDLLGRRAPINSYKLNKMIVASTYSNEKARKELGWNPTSVIDNFKIR